MNMVNVTDSIVILKDAHNHIKISHFTLGLKCRKCERTFGCKQNLKNHLLIHENQRQLKVVTNESCDKRFNNKNNLGQHQAVHTNK